MKTKIEEFNGFPKQIKKHGFNIPNGISLLPMNIETAKSKDELVYFGSAKSLKKLWKSNDIELSKIELEGDRQLYLHQHSAEWIAPTIFLGASLLSESPNTISVALSVVANYVTDLFKGKPPKTKFRMELVIEEEKDKKYKKLTFEGEPNDVSGLIKVIRELKNERKI
jgi:hypothetical protein